MPTEAEWEYAARAGTTSEYYWGDTIDGEFVWYVKNSQSKTHPVAQKKPNDWRLYDMSGNVGELCNDWYDTGYYTHSSSQNPEGPLTGTRRVLRGGFWDNHRSSLRCAARNWSFPGFHLTNVPGNSYLFRCEGRERCLIRVI